MRVVDIKKKEKRESILKSAYELFIERGINSTSISDITRRAKVAKGTFYLYFKNKYELKDMIVINKAHEIFLDAINDLEKKEIKEFHEKIIFITDKIIDYFVKHPENLIFIEKNLSWSFLREVIEEGREDYLIKQCIEEMIEESGYIFEDEELMMYTILELVNSTCHNVIIYNQPVNIGVLKKYLYRDINSIIDNHITGRREDM